MYWESCQNLFGRKNIICAGIRAFPFLILLVTNVGCGTQDYEDPTPKPAVAPAVDWREHALANKEQPAKVWIPLAEGVSNQNKNESCPADTLCIRAPYFGPTQLTDLSSRYPGIVTSHFDSKESAVTFRTIKNVLIESDILDLPSTRLVLCGDTNQVSTSVLQGEPTFDTSGSSCAKKDGGRLSLYIYEYERPPQLVTDGAAGASGSNASVPDGEKYAGSGDTKAARIDVDLNFVNKKGRWPVARAAVDGLNESGGEATAFSNLNKLARMGLYSEQRLENHLNSTCADCDKNVDRWYKSRAAGCFLYFEDEGLFNGASAKVIGEEGLDGKDSDPKKVWKGGDGEVGGNAGLISVFTSRDLDPFSGVISNQFGKGGKGGNGAYQLPGKGVAASIDPVSRRVSEHHWVGCIVKRQGKLVERHDFANPAIRNLDLSFSIGSPSVYNGYGEASGKLEVRRGKDGAALAPEVIASLNGVDGKDGVSTPPELVYLSKLKFLESQTEQCPNCSPLKIVMEKNNDDE